MAMCTDDIDCNKIYPVTEYSISNRIALLINIRHFYDLKSNRHGAEYDAQAVLNLLYNLGYAVVYYQDLTAQEIDEALIRFSKHRKLFNTDSVFVVLMSHGDLGTIRGSDLKNFEIDKIYERLNTKNCPALMNKPKVIIIQACRGENEGVVTVDASRQSMGTENTGPPSKNIAKVGKVHIEKDFIGFHSSTPHTYSYRNPEYGSNFFHYICDVILTGCCQDDIEELFKKVMQQFEDFPSEQKQMPTKERDTLTKHFYLFPGIKHRFPEEKQLHKRLEALRVEPAGGQWLRPGLRKYSCQLTIDTNTVHTNLQLSNNNRKVTYDKEVQSYPDHPERFDFYPQLLCHRLQADVNLGTSN
uniref:caspase-1 n=1 Tax=Maylandia zebra TaxID=106582 RepID=UPI000D31E4E4|nr:caspase-1 [Maylandia zebra]